MVKSIAGDRASERLGCLITAMGVKPVGLSQFPLGTYFIPSKICVDIKMSLLVGSWLRPL
ncbi:MAG: hypothetical protein KME55_08500 [Nostoc indistinguendum CM1-VF10]|nr:hypothetical protein [Nostoc indistinguendum CM1-VF10]